VPRQVRRARYLGLPIVVGGGARGGRRATWPGPLLSTKSKSIAFAVSADGNVPGRDGISHDELDAALDRIDAETLP
jgi:hypothetical protein